MIFLYFFYDTTTNREQLTVMGKQENVYDTSEEVDEIDKLVTQHLWAMGSSLMRYHFLLWVKHQKDSVASRRGILWIYFGKWFKYHDAVMTHKEAREEYEAHRRDGLFD